MATKDISDYECCVAASVSRIGLSTGQALVSMTGQPAKVCERALERAVGRKFLDCGINEWHAFLTPKGRDLLQCRPAMTLPGARFVS